MGREITVTIENVQRGRGEKTNLFVGCKMYRPDKYMQRRVGVPYMYEQESRPKRKKMFNFYESSFHTVQPEELPKVPNRWVSEIRDNYIYYVTEKKSPNQPHRHNYDVYDPLRTTIRKFVPEMSAEQSMPLENVVPPRQRRPQTAPVYDDGRERYEYVRRSGGGGGGSRRKKRQQQHQRVRSEEIDVEERRGSEEIMDDGRMPPDRKKVFTKAEDTKFHSNKTFEEREEEQRDKAIERLKRQAFDGVTNVKPTFVLPKGSRPEFCNYGHGNINPIREVDYMKTFNVKAGNLTELHDYITTRRERTHGYNEWKKYMASTPTHFQPTAPRKKKELTRPKTPPRMHKAKQAGYKGVSHYFHHGKTGDDHQQQQQQKKKVRKRRKKQEEEEEISPRKQGPPQPQPQPRQKKNKKTKRRRRNRRRLKVAPSRGNLRKYMDEELEEVMEHGSNVGGSDRLYYEDDEDDDDDDEDGDIVIHHHKPNETEKKLTKIIGGKIFAFEPKRFNNEDWNPKNYKHLPNEYTCFIRSAGVRTTRDRDKSVSQAMNQFE